MIYCCMEHVGLALNVIVDGHEKAPTLEELKKDGDLSTPCEYCKNEAIYIVGN